LGRGRGCEFRSYGIMVMKYGNRGGACEGLPNLYPKCVCQGLTSGARTALGGSAGRERPFGYHNIIIIKEQLSRIIILGARCCYAFPPLSPECPELFKARQQFNRPFDQGDAARNGTGLEQTRSSICEHLFPLPHPSTISNSICGSEYLTHLDQNVHLALVINC
jgi:hypothetical protein